MSQKNPKGFWLFRLYFFNSEAQNYCETICPDFCFRKMVLMLNAGFCCCCFFLQLIQELYSMYWKREFLQFPRFPSSNPLSVPGMEYVATQCSAFRLTRSRASGETQEVSTFTLTQRPAVWLQSGAVTPGYGKARTMPPLRRGKKV